ncbi:hypothetical protein [Nodosilinea sp. FACHB-13]|uniref:hypothetical protein n=1 Tax=Cyanophyceae TaxID=3028117 RepID=UPI0016879628|nr:hypothetical protein [Nodosilinea sp. FACHB-13]MBD2107129.1 hypothetical protein [Nodosilinea sp. FACHB-13]
MTDNYDGPRSDYVQEIGLSPRLDDLWNHCQGYVGLGLQPWAPPKGGPNPNLKGTN